MTLFDDETMILRGLSHTPPSLNRFTLYRLPPWRAVLWARVAHKCDAMPRAERDGLIREAQIVGAMGELKPYAKRTQNERENGVRAARHQTSDDGSPP